MRPGLWYAVGVDPGTTSRPRARNVLRRMARVGGRTLRCGTLFAAVFFAAVWAGGERTHYQRTFTTNKREVAIYACWGGVMVIHQEVRDWSPFNDKFYRGTYFDLPRGAPLEDQRYEGVMARLSERRRLELELRLGTGEGIWGQRLPRWNSQVGFNPTMVLQLPYWLLTSIFACTSGGLFLFSYLRSRRAKTGHCTACNYSLAGLSPAAACPECGMARVGTEVSPLAGPS